MKIRENNKGFTLTEVLIAVAILSIAVVPMLANFVTSSKVNYKSKRTMNGTTVAQNIMEGINAYGVENTIIQLENVNNPTAPDLKFMPTSMKVANWGRCTYRVTNTNDAEGNTVKIPVYATDSYQDNTRTYSYVGGTVDFADTIEMESMEPGVYTTDGDPSTLNTGYLMKYAYTSGRVGDDQVYFLDDKRKEQLMSSTDYAHAYMFWLKGVEYGTKKYDVLLTMDANYYREYAGKYKRPGGVGYLDTTVASNATDSQGNSITDMTDNEFRTRIGASNDPDHYDDKRTYNDEMLSRITTNTGTNASIDDTTPDRFCATADSVFEGAVSDFVTRCIPGTDRDTIKAALQRDITIEVKNVVNPMDAAKPYRVITVKYEFELMDTSLLNSIDYKHNPNLKYKKDVPVEEIFRSCEKSPRNIYFYYTPNYNAGIVRDIITIDNKGEGDTAVGSDINLFLVRQTDEFASGVTMPSSAFRANEDNYKVQVNLKENLPSPVDLGDLKTHIYTNIGYSLADDGERPGMCQYTVNGADVSPSDVKDKMRVSGLNGINREKGATYRDYIYEVTVQVFEPERNFEPDARIAKFTGSSN